MSVNQDLLNPNDLGHSVELQWNYCVVIILRLLFTLAVYHRRMPCELLAKEMSQVGNLFEASKLAND
jgi:hypothetical protein